MDHRVVRRHNTLGLTAPVPESTSAFHGRPFEVVDGAAIAQRLTLAVTDVEVRGLVARPLVGGIDLVTAGTDLAGDLDRTEALRRLW